MLELLKRLIFGESAGENQVTEAAPRKRRRGRTPTKDVDAETSWRELRVEALAVHPDDVLHYAAHQEEICRRQCIVLFKEKKYYDCLYAHLDRMWFGQLAAAVRGLEVQQISRRTFLNYWAETKIKKCISELKREDAFPEILSKTELFFSTYQAQWLWMSEFGEKERRRIAATISSSKFPDPEDWQAELDATLSQALLTNPRFKEYYSILSGPEAGRFFNEQLAPIFNDPTRADNGNKMPDQRIQEQFDSALAKLSNASSLTFHWENALLYADLCKQLYKAKRYTECLRAHCLRIWHWQLHFACTGQNADPITVESFIRAWSESRIRRTFSQLPGEPPIEEFVAAFAAIVHDRSSALETLRQIVRDARDRVWQSKRQKAQQRMTASHESEALLEELKADPAYEQTYEPLKLVDIGDEFDRCLGPLLNRASSL